MKFSVTRTMAFSGFQNFLKSTSVVELFFLLSLVYINDAVIFCLLSFKIGMRSFQHENHIMSYLFQIMEKETDDHWM
jgi:hypothetical protein